MEVSGGLTLVRVVVEKLGSPIWTQIEAIWGLESQLDKLKDTMSTIEAVLLDAEDQEHRQMFHLSHVERNKLKRLKEALYRADDLCDEIATVGFLKEVMPCNYKMCNEVCLFFSRFNQLYSAFNWSWELKEITEMLDDVVKDHRYDFGSRHPVGLDVRQMRINARETHSYACEGDVMIGREDDKRKVIDMLLNNSVEGDVISVVSIVGIGGLGKTTLARQVYNDDMIVKEFPHRMWFCVYDAFNVKTLFGQILAIVNPNGSQDVQNLDQLQMKLRKELDEKKYLLILDDLWDEDSSKWLKLTNILIGGDRRASRIIVTTRSRTVAEVVRSGSHRGTHELKGLSEDDSLNLLQIMALGHEEHPMQAKLADIGKEIVRKCAYVPLAIRVVGSLLQGQGESKWENLANIVKEYTNEIVPVMKISYDYLPFHLKSCFSYCAILPKGCKIIKEDLICLWIAQGFIMPSDGESFEDVGEEYLKQLLQRCFFQDVERAKGRDEIISFKMHDLIHDLAKEVAGTEILSCSYNKRCYNEKTIHVYIDRNTPKDLLGKLFKMKRMRTFRCDDLQFSSTSLDLLSKVNYLRVLGLNHTELETLPSVIGKLVHLRYLDLSYNKHICILPSSITMLYNLETLKLCDCRNLKGLPRDLRKLVNLKNLDIFDCKSLTDMPPGLSGMTSLQKLSGFVVSRSGTGYAAWNFLTIQSQQSVCNGDKMERLMTTEEVGEVFRSGRMSSLLYLKIFRCNELKCLSGRQVWEHFTALQSLRLESLHELELKDEDDVINSMGEGCSNNEGSGADEMPWTYLAPTLRSLELKDLPKVVKLPTGIRRLSSLHSLYIEDCYNLEIVELSMGGSSSLRKINIINCPKICNPR